MRKVLLLILICSISILVFFLYQQEKNTVMESTLAPFYQILGKPILMADKVLNKTIPVNNADEKKYGESIKLRFSYLRDGSDQYKYLNSLIKELSKNSKKPFQYEVFLLDSYSPNAFATPGGTIFVTKGLLEILKSESELVSILGHELGHVEKGHCFDMVKFELLAKKLGMETLGKLADFIFAFAIKTSYNKTQEDEADEYGYNLIIESKYNPLSTGIAFNRLSQTYSDLESRKANILIEYFQSHPHTVLREEKFSEKAKAWWLLHEEEQRYNGIKNYENLKKYPDLEFEDEWVKGNREQE